MQRHIDEMSATPFLEQIVAQIQKARAAMRADQPSNGNDDIVAAGSDNAAPTAFAVAGSAPEFGSASAAAASTAASDAAGSAPAPTALAPFEIVIYGIGRFAEYAPPLSSAASAADAQLTPQQVRTAIRASSRSPQLQLAAILAVAQRLCAWRADALVAPAEGTAAAAASSASATTSSASPAAATAAPSAAAAASPASQPLIYMYDPMLSSLECSLASHLGVAMIPRNEEGFRAASPTAQATLFYMPHCPQTLSDNVLAANWGVGLRKVMVIGNSMTRYAEQALAKARMDAAAAAAGNETAGYLRASRSSQDHPQQQFSHSSSRGKKKPSAMASILAASPVCCDHDHAPAAATTAAAAAAPASVAPSPSSSPSISSVAASPSPYPHLSAISPWLVEVSLANTHPSRTVFNDLSLHWFALDPRVVQALDRIARGQGHEVDEGTRRMCGALVQRPGAARTPDVSSGAVDAEIISAALTDAPR